MSVRHNAFALSPYAHRSIDSAAGNGPGIHSERLIYAAFILATTGQVTLLVLITTPLLFKVERSTSVVSVLFAILASTIPPYLLIYGSKVRGPDVLGPLCVAQAYILAGSPTMLATALWPAVLDTLVEAHILLLEASTVKLYRIFLIGTPYVTFLVFCGMAAVLDQMYPNQVSQRPYDSVCSLDNTALHIASQILSVLALLTSLCLEIYVLVTVLRPRRIRTLADQTSAFNNPSKLKAKAVQIISFACLQAVVLITSALSNMSSPGFHVTAMFTQASVPPVTSVIAAITATRWTDRIVNVFKRRSDRHAVQQSPSQRRPGMQLEVKINITIEKSVDGRPIMIQIDSLSHEKGCRPV